MDELALSVILATHERPASVLEVARQVVRQAPEGSEIVVVDQSSADGRARVAAGLAALADRRLRHLPQEVAGLPRARNVGIATTRGAVVLFFDDDVRIHPGCIAAHLSRYRDPTVGGVVGRIVEERIPANAWWTTNRIDIGGRIRTRLDGVDPTWVSTLKGANMSLRRRALDDAGPFDPGFAGTALLEDADLSTRVARVGWRLAFEPDAAVDHLHAPTGGCRAPAPEAAAWRFHNTARFVRRHRGGAGLAPLIVTFGAVAAWHRLRHRSPPSGVALARALARGWRGASRLERAAGESHG